MLKYFNRLFEYEFWATEKVLDSLETIKNVADQKIYKLIHHLILANQTWLSRIQGKSSIDMNRLLSISECRKLAVELQEEWKIYLSALNETQFSEKIAYVNSEGTAYETPLSDILTHVVNHGSYHRGQIASLVKQAGGVSAWSDFIGFARK